MSDRPTPSYLAEPLVQYLSQVLDEIRTGALLVPRFQRGIVWNDDQRIELLRSIYSGIPIGSIMVWRTTSVNLETFDRLGLHLLPKPSGNMPSTGRQYLLDGLQRMSTLAGVLLSPGDVSATAVEIEGINWNIYFDLAEEDFRLHSPRLGPPPPSWIPTNILLDSVALMRFHRNLGDERLIQNADRIANAFRNYKIPIVPIVTNNLEEATKAFQRINSQGTPMSDVHMVNALTYSENFELQANLADAKGRLAEVGWENLDQKYILATVRAFKDLEIASPNAEQLSSTLRGSPELIDEAVEALMRVARFLASQFQIPTPSFVPYSYQSVILADVFRGGSDLGVKTEIALVRWFWITTFTSFFLGARGKEVRQALEDVRKIAATGDASHVSTKQPVDRLPERFDFHGARAKALALLLASRKPKAIMGGEINIRDCFSKHGGSALVQVFKMPSLSRQELASPQNRIIYPPDEWPGALAVSLGFFADTGFWFSQAIPKEAHTAWIESRKTDFLRIRRDYMEDFERSFVENLGLTYGDPVRA